MAVVEIQNVSQTFGHGELAVQALKPTSLSIEAGELVALLGPSGSGKSTLLLAISLIQPPTTGRIAIDGQVLFDDGPTGIDVRAFRRQKIGFIFQQHNLIPFLTALENVALMLQLNGVGRRESNRRAMEVLGYLEIGHRADSLPAQMSGGERQRVGIARALMNEPAVLLADEPTAALDDARGREITALLVAQAAERQVATLIVTHNPAQLPERTRRLALAGGKVADVAPSPA